jgi:hypothetical protein
MNSREFSYEGRKTGHRRLPARPDQYVRCPLSSPIGSAFVHDFQSDNFAAESSLGPAGHPAASRNPGEEQTGTMPVSKGNLAVAVPPWAFCRSNLLLSLAGRAILDRLRCRVRI